MIIHEFDLDIVPNGEKREIWLSQYDEDFILKINLYARNGVFTIPTGTTVAIRGTKPDGNGFSADGSLNNNVVTIVGNQQMTAVAGRAVFEITLYDSNEKELSSMNFSLMIERAPLDRDTLPSESVIRELLEVTDQADEIIQAASDAEAYGTGTRGGTPVASGDDAYQNNAKYFSDLASSTLSSKADSTSVAPDYSPTGTYAVGDLRTHEGKLYKCKTAISTAEAWTAGHWTTATVDDELTDVKGDLNALEPGTWSNEAKEALMTCIEHIGVWKDENAQQYIASLRNKLGLIDIDDIMEWEYPSSITAIINGTTSRVSSSDTRLVVDVNTSRRIFGTTAKSIKIMDTNFNPLTISPINVPDGVTGATVTFSIAESLSDVRYAFTRLQETNGYYNVITWTAIAESGVRTSVNSGEKLLLTIYSTGGSSITPTSVRLVFDKNA